MVSLPLKRCNTRRKPSFFRLATLAFVGTLALSSASAQSSMSHRIVVFWQSGFPTIASQPLTQAALTDALGSGVIFTSIDQLRSSAVLSDTSLLVLPYGSAVPVAAWPSILHYLRGGGNLLLLGGQPLSVPVLGDKEGSFTAQSQQDSYSRTIDFRHSYAVPLTEPNHFAWRNGYSFLPKLSVQAETVFAEEGHLKGLGYLDADDGTHLASPIIVSDNAGILPGTRVVALPFNPKNGYWDSPAGKSLIHTAAQYAAAGPTNFFIEAQFSTIRHGELPDFTLHLQQHQPSTLGSAKVELIEGDRILDTATLPIGGRDNDVAVHSINH